MNILWLGQPACSEVARVGGKVANLSRLTAAYRVPPGFCLTTEAYAQWASNNGIDETAEFPAELYGELAAAYQDLSGCCALPQLSVAVRSSAIDEDSRVASFAGQYETFLNVVGAAAIARAVQRCWVSMRSSRALEYRRRYGLLLDHSRLAILVQQVVPADVCAVVFSANPVTGDTSETVINSTWGLGEALVSGRVTPDTYVVRKADLKVVQRQIPEKQRMTVLVPEGTREVEVPRFLRSRPTLDEDQVVEMARLVLSLEQNLGWPVDVECACHNGTLYLLQCRPITTLVQPE